MFKRIALFTVVLCLSFTTIACAARLTCDPTTEPVDFYKLKFDGGAYVETPAVAVEGGKTFYYSLDGLSKGNHTVVGQACNNLWGCSVDSQAFAFEKTVPSGDIFFKLIFP